MSGRTIKVGYLARVEGEGSLVIRFKGDAVAAVELRIFEPPRLFEGFLRGRGLSEAPDITARICGICPVAYQMSACHAMEDALGIRVGGALRELRRLLYCGEWIESHVLHMFLLHLPDFVGVPDAHALAVTHGDKVRMGLRMKKAGNAIVAALGGREIHPINVKVGGFYRAPRREELRALLPELVWCRDAIREALAFLGTLSFPVLERDYEMVALRHPDEYALNEGRIVSSKGLDIDVHDVEAHFVEEHVARSTALHSRIKARGSYLVGPIARFNLSYDRLPRAAQEAAAAVGLVPPVRNPFKSLLVRGVELVFAYDEAIRIIEGYAPPAEPAVAWQPREGVGFGATEAPRGLLYHRYAVDAEGLITEARIVPPTAQNQRTIEEDLWDLGPELRRMEHAEATQRAEHAVRNYDPCISCSTHFLDLRLEEE